MPGSGASAGAGTGVPGDFFARADMSLVYQAGRAALSGIAYPPSYGAAPGTERRSMLVGAVPIAGGDVAAPASTADATATAMAISATEKSLPIHAPFICGGAAGQSVATVLQMPYPQSLKGESG